jgi:hypothetical protein
MNAKLIGLAIAAALFTSTSAFAAQPNGRDSVYAAPGTSFPGAKIAKARNGNGRGSVYAADLPAPTSKTTVGDVKIRFGRA